MKLLSDTEAVQKHPMRSDFYTLKLFGSVFTEDFTLRLLERNSVFGWKHLHCC